MKEPTSSADATSKSYVDKTLQKIAKEVKTTLNVEKRSSQLDIKEK